MKEESFPTGIKYPGMSKIIFHRYKNDKRYWKQTPENMLRGTRLSIHVHVQVFDLVHVVGSISSNSLVIFLIKSDSAVPL